AAESAAAQVLSHLIRGGGKFLAVNEPVAVGVGVTEHPSHGSGFFSRELAVPIGVALHHAVNHLRRIAKGACRGGFLLRDGAVVVLVEFLEGSRRPAEFLGADRAVAVGVERLEEWIASPEHSARAAAAEAAAVFTAALATTGAAVPLFIAEIAAAIGATVGAAARPLVLVLATAGLAVSGRHQYKPECER